MGWKKSYCGSGKDDGRNKGPEGISYVDLSAVERVFDGTGNAGDLIEGYLKDKRSLHVPYASTVNLEPDNPSLLSVLIINEITSGVSTCLLLLVS